MMNTNDKYLILYSRLGFLSQWEAIAERYGVCPPGWPWPNHHQIAIDNQNSNNHGNHLQYPNCFNKFIK